MSFGGFCDTPLWQSNVTWHTRHPRLTPCFEQTVLKWIPFSVLIVFYPLKMCSSIGPRVPSYPMTLLSYARYAFTLYMCLVSKEWELCVCQGIKPEIVR